MKKKNILFISLLTVFITTFVLSVFMIGKYYCDSYTASKQFDHLSKLAASQIDDNFQTQPETQPKPVTPMEQYSALYSQNNDFVGWLAIDGTNISYPVMQTKESPDYYLRRGFDKKYSYHGVPYVEEACDIGVSDNIIIYGHNMLDGSMLSAVDKYKNKDFYETHKYITFNTLEEYGTYEVIAVMKSSPKLEQTFQYYGFINAWDKDHFANYIYDIKSYSLYDTGVSANYGDKLLTISTCEYSVDNGRLAIIAKKIN